MKKDLIVLKLTHKYAIKTSTYKINAIKCNYFISLHYYNLGWKVSIML